jgi:hypothetical protein
MEKIKNYGLILEEPKQEDYIFGVSPIQGEVLCPNRDWADWLPSKEYQRRNNVETCNCTGFAFLNTIEIFINRITDKLENFSDRFTGISAGTRPPGNSPHTVGEAIRKTGLVNESLLPFNDSIDTIEKYYSPDPLAENLKQKGQEWLKQFDFKHEYLWTGNPFIEEKQKIILDALMYSPVAISVMAWKKEGDKYIKPAGSQDNHFVCLFKADEGKSWFVFDTYPESEGDFIKELDWNYDFQQAKRIWLKKKDPTIQEQISFAQKCINALIELWKMLISTKQTVNEFVSPQIETQIEEVKVETSKYLWDTPQNCRHSVRVICDEEGLNWNEKTLISQVVHCESDYNPKAEHKNTDGTYDWGICQWNSKWWAGEGKLFSSKEEIFNNPEKCIREMIKQYKKRGLGDWVCYNKGLYKKFSA